MSYLHSYQMPEICLMLGYKELPYQCPGRPYVNILYTLLNYCKNLDGILLLSMNMIYLWYKTFNLLFISSILIFLLAFLWYIITDTVTLLLLLRLLHTLIILSATVFLVFTSLVPTCKIMWFCWYSNDGMAWCFISPTFALLSKSSHTPFDI